MEIQVERLAPQTVKVNLDPGLPIETESGSIWLPVVQANNATLEKTKKVTLTEGSDVAKVADLEHLAPGMNLTGQVTLKIAELLPQEMAIKLTAPAKQSGDYDVKFQMTVQKPVVYMLELQQNVGRDSVMGSVLQVTTVLHEYDIPPAEDGLRVGDKTTRLGTVQLTRPLG